jgi:ribosomal protein S19
MNFHDHFQLLSPTPNSLKKLEKKGEKIKKIKKKKGSSVCMPDLLGCHMNIHNHDFNLKG